MIFFQLSSPQAVTVACFYLRVRSLKDISTKKLKETAKKMKIPVPKDSNKEALAVFLGKHLFEKEVVVLSNQDKLLEHDNLKINA